MQAQRTLRNCSGLVGATVVTVFILCIHNFAPATAQEKTEPDYGGGDYGDKGSDFGQNGLYDDGDIVVESNNGEGAKPGVVGKPHKVRDDNAINGQGAIANQQREKERQAEARAIADLLIKELKKRITKMDDREFKRLYKEENMRLAFPVKSFSTTKPGELFRLDTVALIHQVYEDAARVRIDGQWVWLDTKTANRGAEFNAQKGRQRVANAKQRVSFLAIREEARDIEGTFCIPVRNAERYLTQDHRTLIKEYIEGENQRRVDEQAEIAEERLREKNKKLINLITKQLKRTFSTNNQKHAIVAAAVGLSEDGQVTLIRWDNKKEIEVPIKKLSVEDQTWITDNTKTIRRRGPQLKKLLQKP